MKPIELKTRDFIHPATGAGITFHMMRWDERPVVDSVGLQQASNVLFHSFADKTVAHYHQFFEIVIILKGQLIHRVNGSKQTLLPGNIVFVRPHDFHLFELGKDEEVELVNLVLDSDLVDRLRHYLASDLMTRRLLTPPISPCFKLSISEAEELGLRLLKINGMQITAPEAAAVKIRALTAELFSEFFLDESQFIKEKSMPAWLENLCRKMKRLPSLVDGLEEMNASVSCTQSHLCKSFRKYIGKSPTEFINELRLQRAAKMLVEEDDKVLAIAYDLGFQSLSRFYSLFRQMYGVAPAKYRQLSRANQIPTR